jgi:hypothetical protein
MKWMNVLGGVVAFAAVMMYGSLGPSMGTDRLVIIALFSGYGAFRLLSDLSKNMTRQR